MTSTDPAIAVARLRSLAPVSELTQSAFRDLLGQTSFRAFRGGARIYGQGESDDWTLFLLDGSVALEQGERRTELRSGQGAAQGPLSTGQQRNDSARAISDCTIAQVPTSLLTMLIEECRPSVAAIEVAELSNAGDSLQEQIMLELYEAYTNDALKLPSLPDIAIRIREAVDAPYVTAQEVERIVTADPAVAARLIQVANSPAYAGAAHVETCKGAVTRLGFAATREFVTSMVLKQVFKTTSAMLKKKIYELWQHSTYVAAISYQLARVLGGFSPDRALLSGLVHDIGALPVLAVIESHSQSANLSPEGLTACINGLQGQVGAMVLRHWAFPDDLVTVALEAEDWERAAKPTGSHGEADYCDLVLIAQLFSFMGTPHIAKYPSISAVPAFGRLMLGKLSPEETLTTLDDARHDIEDLKRMISN